MCSSPLVNLRGILVQSDLNKGSSNCFYWATNVLPVLFFSMSSTFKAKCIVLFCKVRCLNPDITDKFVLYY